MIRTFTSLAAIALIAACNGAPVNEAATAPAAPEVAAPGEADAPGDEALVQPERDALDRMDDTCGMRVVRGFLGEQADTIPAERLPERFRILAPDDHATMDYIAQRLNILTDEDGMVIGFNCG